MGICCRSQQLKQSQVEDVLSCSWQLLKPMPHLNIRLCLQGLASSVLIIDGHEIERVNIQPQGYGWSTHHVMSEIGMAFHSSMAVKHSYTHLQWMKTLNRSALNSQRQLTNQFYKQLKAAKKSMLLQCSSMHALAHVLGMWLTWDQMSCHCTLHCPSRCSCSALKLHLEPTPSQSASLLATKPGWCLLML